jgi:hypothetical protein
MKHILSLLFGLVLVGSGCASLRPPAQDKAAWEGEQTETQKMTPQEESAWNLLYHIVSGVASAF